MKSSSASLYFNLLGGLALVVLLAFVVVGWAAKTEVSGAVIAEGVVAARENSKNVQHLEGGIISGINVKEGDFVKNGQVLLHLDRTKIVAKLHIIESQLAELTIEKARLMSEWDDKEDIIIPKSDYQHIKPDLLSNTIESQRKLLFSRRGMQSKKKNQLVKQIVQIQSAISGLEARLESNRKQLRYAKEELAILTGLSEKGLAARSRIVAMQREVIRLEGQTGESKADIARLVTRGSEIEIMILELDEQWRTDVLTRLAELRLKIANLEQQRLFERSLLHRTEIVAPISGYIHNLKVHTVNGVVSPGQGLMTIVPAGVQMIVRAWVRPMDIDQIHTGQSVRLHFVSLNRSKMSDITGKVVVVGADQTINPNTDQAFFRVDIALKYNDVDKQQLGLIKLGMPVQAYITTEQRTVMDYLIKPISDQLVRSFREI
ncbi:MAG: HlyD family type I secretion periplasmic adaptor subunit [Rhizobiaceae bacterium]